MVRTVTLRPWQKAALERLAASASPDLLAVATPGAGKTTFALTAARQELAHPEGEKERPRKANADASRLIARQIGRTHSAVNAELNRWSGVTKVSEATIELLERRLRKAEQWRRQSAPRRSAG